MMLRIEIYVLVVFSLLVVETVAYAQQMKESDSIYWSTNYKLQWSDFEGIPPKESNWKAVCSSHIKAKGFRDGQLPNFRVRSYFLRSESWTKDTSCCNLLEHERLHFDIAEIFARKIRQAVDSLRTKGEESVEIYSKAIESNLSDWDKWTELYDDETSNGLRPSIQLQWAIKIEKELVILTKYATSDEK